MSNIHQLYTQSNPLRHIIRIGHTGHRALENLHTARLIPIQHAVIDASHAQSQRDLLHCLTDGGVEIILDTKPAELSMPAGLTSRART